jgi:hypothetical protein
LLDSHREEVVTLSQDKIVTAAELAAMSPEERHKRFQASIVRDPDTLPARYLDQIRARSRETIARRDAQQAAQDSQRAS